MVALWISLGVFRAIFATRDQVVAIRSNVGQERLRCIKLSPLTPYRFEAPVDHAPTSLFTSVEHLSDLGEPQSHLLAGLNDVQAAEVFLCVLAMPRSRAVRDDDALVVPVAQHVRRDPELGRRLRDFHGSNSRTLDFRLT